LILIFLSYSSDLTNKELNKTNNFINSNNSVEQYLIVNSLNSGVLNLKNIGTKDVNLTGIVILTKNQSDIFTKTIQEKVIEQEQ
jgi:hypothetical protein